MVIFYCCVMGGGVWVKWEKIFLWSRNGWKILCKGSYGENKNWVSDFYYINLVFDIEI